MMLRVLIPLAFVLALIGWGWLAQWADRLREQDHARVLAGQRDARVLPFRKRGAA